MLDMLDLGRIEVVEQLPGFRCVVTVAGKVRDSLLLLRNETFAVGDMPVGLF